MLVFKQLFTFYRVSSSIGALDFCFMRGESTVTLSRISKKNRLLKAYHLFHAIGFLTWVTE